MQRAYQQDTGSYPDVIGISTLFRHQANLDEPAREGRLPDAQLSWSLIGNRIHKLALVSYEMRLYITPMPGLRDHHTLAVLHNGVVEPELRDDAADALLRALRVIDNLYQRPERLQP